MGTVWRRFPHPSRCPSPCWWLSQGSSVYLNCQLTFLLKFTRTHGSSLAVQWLRPRPFTAIAWVQSLAEKLRSCKPCGAVGGKKKTQQKWEFLFSRYRVIHVEDLKRKKIKGSTENSRGFAGGSTVENLPAVQETWVQDSGLISGSGWSSREGNDNPLQYSCWKNFMDRGAWQVTTHGITRVRHDLATKPQGSPTQNRSGDIDTWAHEVTEGDQHKPTPNMRFGIRIILPESS